MLKKMISLFLIFIIIIGFYYYNQNGQNTGNTNNNLNTATQLASAIEPAIIHGQVIYSNLRDQLGINSSLINCSINSQYIDLEELYSKANITTKLYTSEMTDAWLKENYSKYVVLLTVYREYIGLRNFVKYPTSNEKVMLDTIGDLCKVRYVVENIDSLTQIVDLQYDFSLPNNYTFSKIEKMILDEWRTKEKLYTKTFDYRESYLAAPESTFNWALYGAWLEVLNCSYLSYYNITYEEAYNGIVQIVNDLRKTENTMLLLMLYYYLEEDIYDIKMQSTDHGSMGTAWRKCINSIEFYKNVPFNEFAFIIYYAWFKNSHIYDILYIDNS